MYATKDIRPKRWTLLFLLPMLFLLSSCYLPYGYLTKIQISNDGRYELTYQGRILAASFIKKMSELEIEIDTPEYESEKNIHLSELSRLGFNNIEYTYPASYDVTLDRKGNLFKERMVSFPSRQGTIIVLKLLKNNQLVIQSRRLNKGYVDQLNQSGIDFVGSVVVWTDMKITNHNANIVQQGNPDAYIWEFSKLDDDPLQIIGTLGQ